MRTAIILATKHDAQFGEVIHREAIVNEQRETFRQYLPLQEHAEFREFRLVELEPGGGGVVRVVRCRPSEVVPPKKSTMKKIISLITLSAALAFTPQAFSQSSGVQYTPNGYASVNFTNQANAVSTNWGTTTPTAITLGPIRQKSITAQIELQMDAVGAVTFTLPYQLSTDGTSYNTALQTIAISFNGVTKQTVTTNINLYGNGFIKFPYFTNSIAAGAANGTNCFFRVPLNYNSP